MPAKGLSDKLRVPDNIQDMSACDFAGLQDAEHYEDIEPFDSLVVMPTEEKHDSGYRIIEYVACLGKRPLCRITGCGDLLSLGEILRKTSGQGWFVDCLGMSGLIRIRAFGSAKLIVVAEESAGCLAIKAIAKG